jgi:hypothetical protein
VLISGKRIARVAVSVSAADVTDADAVRIVAPGMGALLADAPPALNGAVDADDVVIADIGPAASKVPGANLLSRDLAALWRSAAVQDDALDVPHFSFF